MSTATGTPEAGSVTTAPAAVVLTEKAAQMVLEAMALEDAAGQLLRVGVVGGGCQGLQYLLDFTPAATPHDETFNQHGVEIAIDPFSASLLGGTVIDYVTSGAGDAGGFKFINPHIQRGCGCGSARH